MPLLIINPDNVRGGRVRRRRARRNREEGEKTVSIDELREMLNDEELDQLEMAIERFQEFHGCEPCEVVLVDSDLGEDEHIEILVGLGRAPADSYDAEDIAGSSKKNELYVHPYGEEGGQRPLKAVTADGKTVLTVGHLKVSDWIRDDE